MCRRARVARLGQEERAEGGRGVGVAERPGGPELEAELVNGARLSGTEIRERNFLRQGDLLYYNFTVNDPEVLMEPWTSYTYVRRVAPNPARLDEAPQCDERDLKLLADPFLRG